MKGKTVKEICEYCEEPFGYRLFPSQKKRHFCSVPCYNKAQSKRLLGHWSGSDNPSWKGGKQNNSDGYIYMLCPEHPYANAKRCVAEHRLIMEKHAGRYLKPEEIVHHKNGVNDDNRIGNLILCENHDEHMFLHRRTRGRYKKRLVDGKEVYAHRLIIEKWLGRKLRSDERVSHIDGNNSDNRICNLRITGSSERRIYRCGY